MFIKIRSKLRSLYFLFFSKKESKIYTRVEYIKSPVEIEYELLKLFNKNDSLKIFDIGACEAEDSIRYSNLFPNSTIYAFEPRKDNYAKAKELINQYNKLNIILENTAFSNQNGVADFYLSEGNPPDYKNSEEWNFGNKSSSLLVPSIELKKHYGWLEFNNKIQVQTIRIDEYVVKENITSIDFAHIDVQGAELLVLEGAGNFVSQIKAIFLEVEAVELYTNQPVKYDIELFMKQNKFVNIFNSVNQIDGDQLYVNLRYYSEEWIKNSMLLKL